MTIVFLLLLILINFFWLLLTLIGLPGTWLMAATTLGFAWWRWNPALDGSHQIFSPATLFILVGLAILGEVWEFSAGMAGAKMAGGSAWGAAGALIGSIVGGIVGTFAIPIPLIGSLLGACGGAAAGAFAGEALIGRSDDEALRSGIGAGIGRLRGTLAKMMVAVVMWIWIAVAAFWP